MHAPDREHVGRVAAADVDDVLAQHEVAQLADGAVEELQVRRLAAVLCEGAMEAGDVIGRVAARGRNEEDARAFAAGEREEPAVQAGIARLHAEAAAAESGDAFHAATQFIPRCARDN